MRNIGVGIFCLLFAIAALGLMSQFPDEAASHKDPAAYPEIIVYLIALIGVILLVQGIISVVKNMDKRSADSRRMVLPVAILGIMIMYVLLMHIFGFILSSLLFLFFVFLSFGGTKRQGAVFAPILTLAEYVVFVWVLHVRLPEPLFGLIYRIF